MNKTRVVQLEKKVRHPLYDKYVKTYTKMYVHDESNLSKQGDVVLVEQCRPLSKTKRWTLTQILKRDE